MPSLFTKIINGDIPGEIVYEDSRIVAFKDIDPVAPIHILIVPREEISGVAQVPEEGDHFYLLNVAKKIAHEFGLDKDGYRLVINQGKAAGQTVAHLHVHLLGGRDFSWPPG